MVNPPVPFIVCHPRSGSTLLRLILDSHPDLAIPPETMLNSVFQLSREQTTASELPEAVLDAMVSSQRWNDLGISRDEMRSKFIRLEDQFNISDALRTLYKHYAAKHGKSRFGDKTPGHVFWIQEIAELLPEAVFIHIVRDGRDVISSIRKLWFSPGQDIQILADSWCKWVRAFEVAKTFPHRYLEIRYEDLVSDPERVIRHILAAIDLPFHADVLHHSKRAAERLLEFGELRSADGALYATAQDLHAIHRHTLKPPNKDQIGRFRADLSREEITIFEATAGSLLKSFGYELVSEEVEPRE